jgi:hypothetical protein
LFDFELLELVDEVDEADEGHEMELEVGVSESCVVPAIVSLDCVGTLLIKDD